MRYHTTTNGNVPFTPEEEAEWDAKELEHAAGALDRAKAAKLTAIHAEKSRARDAGFLVSGVLWDSDQSARVSYAEIALKLMVSPSFTTPWKASEGVWVEMNATLYAKVTTAGEGHIQSCFGWQYAREAEVAAATTVESVQAVSEHYPDA